MIPNNAMAVATRIAAVIASTLESMIWNGVSGDTSNCSTVPGSFSRTSAAAGSMIAKIVIMRRRYELDSNQLSVWFGLYQTR